MIEVWVIIIAVVGSSTTVCMLVRGTCAHANGYNESEQHQVVSCGDQSLQPSTIPWLDCSSDGVKSQCATVNVSCEVDRVKSGYESKLDVTCFVIEVTIAFRDRYMWVKSKLQVHHENESNRYLVVAPPAVPFVSAHSWIAMWCWTVKLKRGVILRDDRLGCTALAPEHKQ